jgi:hypothetical protein
LHKEPLEAVVEVLAHLVAVQVLTELQELQTLVAVAAVEETTLAMVLKADQEL